MKSKVEESKAELDKLTNHEFTLNMRALIRSRNPLIYLVSIEEKRILTYYKLFAKAFGYKVNIWDCYNGLNDIISNKKVGTFEDGDSTDPVSVLDFIIKEANNETITDNKEDAKKANIYILFDFHRFLQPCTPEIERRLRFLYRIDSRTNIIIVGPHFVTTPALEKCMSVIDFPYPNYNEIKETLYKVANGVIEQVPSILENTRKNEDDIIKSASGLTSQEVELAFAKSLVIHKNFNIQSILDEKKQIIRKSGILDFFVPNYGINDIGGLNNLRTWIKQRKLAFSSDAKEYGLSRPKGILLLGIPGVGKSLSAKAIAKEYNYPLLRLDFGSLFNSLVGESERNIRNALSIAEGISPCILWCDEIEKGISGLKSSGQSDSGTTSRVIGTFLTWMQEKKSDVFIVCTANQHDNLPAEFLRAGRFDEVFFIDLPTSYERAEIFEVLLRRKNKDIKNFDINKLVFNSDGFTGAEIEKAIELAMLDGFYEDQREINTLDIVNSFNKFKPISTMKASDIEEIRKWAKSHCILANTDNKSEEKKETKKDIILYE